MRGEQFRCSCFVVRVTVNEKHCPDRWVRTPDLSALISRGTHISKRDPPPRSGSIIRCESGCSVISSILRALTIRIESHGEIRLKPLDLSEFARMNPLLRSVRDRVESSPYSSLQSVQTLHYDLLHQKQFFLLGESDQLVQLFHIKGKGFFTANMLASE
jgi:hypothetical protein